MLGIGKKNKDVIKRIHDNQENDQELFDFVFRREASMMVLTSALLLWIAYILSGINFDEWYLEDMIYAIMVIACVILSFVNSARVLIKLTKKEKKNK